MWLWNFSTWPWKYSILFSNKQTAFLFLLCCYSYLYLLHETIIFRIYVVYTAVFNVSVNASSSLVSPEFPKVNQSVVLCPLWYDVQLITRRLFSTHRPCVNPVNDDTWWHTCLPLVVFAFLSHTFLTHRYT